MKRKLIIGATILITLLPIGITGLLLWLNICDAFLDKNFWYYYMQFAGTVLLAGFALYQTQKNNDDNTDAQERIGNYQRDLVNANKDANDFAIEALKMNIRNEKAIFVPEGYTKGNNGKLYLNFIEEILVAKNIGADFAIIDKTVCVCDDKILSDDNINEFIGNQDGVNTKFFKVNPALKDSELKLYIFLKNKYNYSYTEAIYINYSYSERMNILYQFTKEKTNIKFFDGWKIQELEDIENGQP